MNSTALVSIAATGFSVAFFHAAIPTHWLPFVLASREQGWSRPRTLAVTAIAGGGHVLFTTVLGVLVAGLGMAVDQWTGDVFPKIAGGLLIAFGGYYLVQQVRGKGHGHSHVLGGHGHDHVDHEHGGHEHGGHEHSPHDHGAHDHGGHDHGHAHAAVAVVITPPASAPARSDRAVILGLLALLTFSPCEGFLPVYVSGITYGWWGFALLSFVLAAATLAGMVLFTALTLSGLERLRLGFIEKYEGAVLGGLLCVLGVLVILLES
jgi:ABC-type nickel/cobalt efflux system permease component RcnA